MVISVRAIQGFLVHQRTVLMPLTEQIIFFKWSRQRSTWISLLVYLTEKCSVLAQIPSWQLSIATFLSNSIIFSLILSPSLSPACLCFQALGPCRMLPLPFSHIWPGSWGWPGFSAGGGGGRSEYEGGGSYPLQSSGHCKKKKGANSREKKYLTHTKKVCSQKSVES